MSFNDLTVYEFQPLWLTLDRVGPFRNTPYEIDFTDAQDRPCNIFLLMSENGRGKTTVLECIALLMRQLGEESPAHFQHDDLDTIDGGRIQLDVLTRIYWQGSDHRIILSLVAGNIGENTFLKVWEDGELEKYDADSWHKTGFRLRSPGRLEVIGKHDEMVQDLRAALIDAKQELPENFADSTLDKPTTLYFPAYRDIPPINSMERTLAQPENWSYSTVHEFASHGTHWTASLDNLLIWLKWLDNGSFEKAVKTVNDVVFTKLPDKRLSTEVNRVALEAIMINGKNEHRLDRLSSGEKNMLQLFLRIGAHSTRNTWLLIDELDVHLHPKWQTKITYLMQDQILVSPGTTVIAAAHSPEVLDGLAFDDEEAGLVKGGWIIKEGLL